MFHLHICIRTVMYSGSLYIISSERFASINFYKVTLKPLVFVDKTFAVIFEIHDIPFASALEIRIQKTLATMQSKVCPEWYDLTEPVIFDIYNFAHAWKREFTQIQPDEVNSVFIDNCFQQWSSVFIIRLEKDEACMCFGIDLRESAASLFWRVCEDRSILIDKEVLQCIGLQMRDRQLSKLLSRVCGDYRRDKPIGDYEFFELLSKDDKEKFKLIRQIHSQFWSYNHLFEFTHSSRNDLHLDQIPDLDFDLLDQFLPLPSMEKLPPSDFLPVCEASCSSTLTQYSDDLAVKVSKIGLFSTQNPRQWYLIRRKSSLSKLDKIKSRGMKLMCMWSNVPVHFKLGREVSKRYRDLNFNGRTNFLTQVDESKVSLSGKKLENLIDKILPTICRKVK